MNEKGKTGNKFFTRNIIIVIIVSLVWISLSGLGIFKKIDYRIYDFMLKLKPSPKSVENITFVNVDDQSINALGEWPWSRDVLADCLIRMKELGAKEAVFDIEYLSPSQLGVDPDALLKSEAAFEYGKVSVLETLGYFTDAATSGKYSKKEIRDISQEVIESGINPIFSDLLSNVTSNMYRDNDEYFARAIQFFGNTWLTINTHDVSIEIAPDEINYVKSRFLLDNVIDTKGFVINSNNYTFEEEDRTKGFTPAMHSLVAHSKGLGFTNVVIDEDGTRRRIELLTEYDGKYASQLVFSPILKELAPEEIIRKKSTLILKKCVLPNKPNREDIRIPLDENGRMLINWLHTDFKDSFRSESVMFLIQLDQMELDIYNLIKILSELNLLDKNGELLQCVVEAKELQTLYSDILDYKKALLDKCEGYDEQGNPIGGGIESNQYDDYFKMRASYFDGITKYISSNYNKEFIKYYKQLIDGTNTELVQNSIQSINEVFEALKSNNQVYNEYIADMQKTYKNAFCIIGDTAASTSDMGATPFIRSYFNVGTHANIYNTILQQDFIIPVPWYYGVLIALFLALLPIIVSKRTSHTFQTIIGISGVVGIVIIFICIMIFASVYIPIFSPFLIVFSSFIVDTIFRFISIEKEKSFIRNAFSTYVAGSVVDQIVDDPDKLKLGGEEKHITALFTDIKSFSGFSELVTPTKLVTVLNEYLGTLSDVILSEKGTIDKYIGDAIVSFFGAPIDFADHAWHAVSSAIKMKSIEKEFNTKHLADGDIPRSLETRVGINTGDMVVGNMGTNMKLNYTIMGSDVNLASRLEGVNKVYKSWVLASEQTWKEADSGEHKGLITARRFDRIRVVGIDKPVQLYNIVGFTNELPKDYLESIEIFHKALDLYLAKDFKGALKLFNEAYKLYPEDESPTAFVDRCKYFIAKGVPEDWDGVMNMTSK